MSDIVYAILQNIFVVGGAVVGCWLVIKNIRWQMESENTDAEK